jgi:hypothetical protein
MLGISGFPSEGGSYRTISIIFNTEFNWPLIRWLLNQSHLLEKDDIILMAGDEVNVTKSGKKTHGLGRFFGSKYGKTVPSLYFLNLSLIVYKNRRSSPIMMEQVMQNDSKIFKESDKINAEY